MLQLKYFALFKQETKYEVTSLVLELGLLVCASVVKSKCEPVQQIDL